MSHKSAIGIDIGGTYIKWALVESKGNILNEGKTQTPGNSDDMAQFLNDVIHDLNTPSNNVLGVGIGVPGFYNSNSGRVEEAYNLKALTHLSFIEQIQNHHTLPFFIDNDANNAAKGEYLFGKAKNTQDCIVITLGTGIGSGIILNNTIYKGLGKAGEIGHLTLIPNGQLCTCGNYGCFEAYGSTTALIAMTKEALKRGWESSLQEINEISGSKISKAAQEGDSLAIQLIDQWTYYIGLGLSNVINLLNLPLIVIGGGISSTGSLILDPIEKYTNQFVLPKLRNSFKIVPAELQNSAGVLGSASSVFMEIE